MGSNVDLLLEVAHMYYEQDMTQQEIANKIFLSRSKVSRLIKEAKELGLVEITIKSPFENHEGLENLFHSRFHLKNILVANTEGFVGQDAFHAVCKLGAKYLNDILRNDSIFSISRGKTMSNLLKNLNPMRPLPDMQVVQLAGAFDELYNPDYDEIELVRQVSIAYGCGSQRLILPYFLENKQVKDVLISQSSVQKVMEMANQVNIFCSGVDTFVFWSDFLSESEQAFLRKADAVGCIWGHFFDMDGNIIDTPLYDRVVIPPKKVLQNTETRVCVACDRFKAKAILGALRGGLINVLITDSRVAHKILALDEKG